MPWGGKEFIFEIEEYGSEKIGKHYLRSANLLDKQGNSYLSR